MTTLDQKVLSEDSPGISGRWLILFLLALDYFTLYTHRSLLGYLKRPLMDGLDMSSTEFGWLNPAFHLPYALSQIAVGYLGDRFSRRSILLWSLFTSVLALVAMGLTQNFVQIAALRVLLGVGQAASVPAIAGVMADSFTSRTRSTAVSIYLVSYNLGLILAAWCGGLIADVDVWIIPLGVVGGPTLEVTGWRMALFFFAAVGALAGLLFFTLFREPERTERESTAGKAHASLMLSIREVLRVRTYWALLFVFVFSSMVVLALQHWLAGYLEQRFSLSLEDAGFQATVWIQSATVVGLLIGGKLGDVLARRRMIGRMSVQMAGLALMAPALILIGTGDVLWLLSFPMLVYGLGVGFYQANLWTTTFEVVDPAARSTAIGLLNVASGTLGFWCNPLIGLYETQGGDVGLALAALSTLVLLALGILFFSGKVLLPADYRGPLKKK